MHQFRIGHGYDLHRLEPLPPHGNGRPMVLGGVVIEHDRGPVAHSDGDAVFHAITDALLGGIAAADIGQQFPDTSAEHDNEDSSRYVIAALSAITHAGYRIGNLDVTIICQQPRISRYKHAMRISIADLLQCDTSQVNVKGKSHEGVDAVGEGRAIEVHAIVLLTAIE
ncbi:MAG: 2-C-methyl-D-erythritol 2,4-cyclodiphosphate synthase [Phycisphaerales bacterium]